MKKKVDARLKKFILNQHKINPGLGVRKLAVLLEKKYGFSLSKSTVHSILKSNNVKLEKGPKKAKSIYKKKTLDECGLILLQCIDNYLGLFAYIGDELNVYFPKLKKELLNKFLILISSAAATRQDLEKAVRRKDYLRLAGLYRLSVKKFNYFRKQIERYQPVVELSKVRTNLTIVSGLKIIFKDNSYIFSDSKMTTLWDSVPKIEYFFSPLKYSEDRVKKMINQGLFIFGYTKSFNSFSPLVFKLIAGFKKGLAAIQFLDTQEKVIRQIEVEKDIEFLLGYYPQGISKGVELETGRKKYKQIHFPYLGGVYILNILSKLSEVHRNKKLTLNNVLIRNKNYGLPSWGLIASYQKISKPLLKSIVNKYLYLWPDKEESFFTGTKAVEQSFLTKDEQKKEIIGILPHKLKFLKLADFSRVGQLLSIVFKELIEGIEPKGKSGFLENGNDYLLVNLNKITAKTKKRLNKQAFFIKQKRIFFR